MTHRPFFQVIETTRCTQARAELALYDNDNDLAAAIDYILEHGSEIESWTEQKSKKDKKKEEEEKRPARGQSSTRGRGGFGDRGGRGRGRGDAITPRGASRGASMSGRGRGGPVNSGSTRPVSQKPQSDESVTKTADTDSVDEGCDWVSFEFFFFSLSKFSHWLHETACVISTVVIFLHQFKRSVRETKLVQYCLE